jgi:hypothetical protein
MKQMTGFKLQKTQLISSEACIRAKSGDAISSPQFLRPLFFAIHQDSASASSPSILVKKSLPLKRFLTLAKRPPHQYHLTYYSATHQAKLAKIRTTLPCLSNPQGSFKTFFSDVQQKICTPFSFACLHLRLHLQLNSALFIQPRSPNPSGEEEHSVAHRHLGSESASDALDLNPAPSSPQTTIHPVRASIRMNPLPILTASRFLPPGRRCSEESIWNKRARAFCLRRATDCFSLSSTLQISWGPLTLGTMSEPSDLQQNFCSPL